MNGGSVRPTVAAHHPHAPTSICSTAVTYDANGNTLSYDPDGSAGPIQPRTITYDRENCPISVTQNGNTASFDYGPDSERTGKSFLGQTRYFLGADAEVAFDAATPQRLLTSYLHPDVKREGTAADFLLKDHLASNRLLIRMGGATTKADYAPYGQPLTTNGSSVLTGKAYINERFDPETGLIYLPQDHECRWSHFSLPPGLVSWNQVS
ncbi:hypothetical protein [Aestuariivirga sp.]|uniref:hypothetical protein n=1 Tax=Aestuariivirga sp. TaxID=2650926 RepID=UPI003BAD97D4